MSAAYRLYVNTWLQRSCDTILPCRVREQESRICPAVGGLGTTPKHGQLGKVISVTSCFCHISNISAGSATIRSYHAHCVRLQGLASESQCFHCCCSTSEAELSYCVTPELCLNNKHNSGVNYVLPEFHS